MGKPGSATAPVTAHFRFASIRIKVAPLEIGFMRSFDQDETICPDRDSSSTNFSNEVFQTILFQEGFPMIDEDEVIATPAHL
jgi:hypothetical protein